MAVPQPGTITPFHRKPAHDGPGDPVLSSWLRPARWPPGGDQVPAHRLRPCLKLCGKRRNAGPAPGSDQLKPLFRMHASIITVSPACPVFSPG
jgi:hypothetical protein